jgi:hypothetical protein
MKSEGEFSCAYRPPPKHKKTMSDPIHYEACADDCSILEDPHLPICTKTITQLKRGASSFYSPPPAYAITWIV